ncbi:MAG TPA: matrixin family metalloprotease [Lacipirellulaceae bacterium]
MRLLPNWRCFWLLLALVCFGQSADAITVTIDYNYDSSNFFGAGNPQGAAAGLQAKTTLEAAASFFSNLLTDSLSVIQTPAEYHSSAGGFAIGHWTADFENPSTGADKTLTDITIPANQYRIYVGAQPLGGNEAGHGAIGGIGFSFNAGGNFNSQSEIDQIMATEAEFDTEVHHRDKPTGFADWGGAIAFASNDVWHFDYTTPPEAATNDFYSVALHELGHTLGLGSSDEWNALVNQAAATFNGNSSKSQFGGPVPLSTPDLAHWANGTMSKIYGTTTSQTAVMTPSLTQGTRKKFTSLDVAGLTDVGWSVAAPPVLVGDYNGNGIVDAADYTVWRDTLGSMSDLRANGNNSGASAGKIDQADYVAWKANFGHTAGGAGAGLTGVAPEPTSGLLLALGGCLTACLRAVRRVAVVA